MIAWDEGHDYFRITLEYEDECHGNRDTSATIYRLRDNTRSVDVP